jgi:CheY-like chemotaxis protein
MLESLGCQVVLAQDGDEAVRIFRREPQRYDLVMLDVRMPRLDGVEAYLQMRACRVDICSLVTSGYSQDERLNEMVQDPCCGFLAKPFDLNALQKALKKLPLRKKI